jgi:hypothetical protein
LIVKLRAFSLGSLKENKYGITFSIGTEINESVEVKLGLKNLIETVERKEMIPY